MKILSLLLLLPVVTTAQTVEPVISKDYLDHINNKQQKIFYNDTTNSAREALLLLSNNYYGYPIQKIRVKNGYLDIKRAHPKTLFLSGSFNSSVVIKTINHLPALQNEYVQGRSQNGNLLWRGAETNEQYSYGPSINNLEYDGSNYLYDVNGRLVQSGAGNGMKAMPYSNSIFRTGSLLSQSLVVQTRYVNKGTYITKLKLGQSDEQTVIKRNKNSGSNFSLLEDVSLRLATINVSFTNATEKFSNSNRNGFLNRVYQNSLLTPISFDNSQGFLLANDQRRYSNTADNPMFLLEDNGNSFFNSHSIGSLAIEKKFNSARFKIIQSIEKAKEKGNEIYKPTTAFFPNGIFANRKKTDTKYYLNASGSVDVRYGGSVHSIASFNYAFNSSKSSIDYATSLYKYKRSSHDVDINYLTTFNLSKIEGGVRVGNKFYASNTSLRNDFFLPEVSGYVLLYDIFNADRLNLKLASNYIEFNSEIPINTSFSQYGLTKLSTEESFQFFPTYEVKSYNRLLPMSHKEWTARAEFSYKYQITLTAEVFNRKTNDDVFPLYDNNELVLKNITDHRNTGVEIIANYYSRRRDISTNNTVSFTTYKDIVTNVANGLDFTPVAGFKNIHKAIVKGEPLGVIVGSSFLHDRQNNIIIIGSNGFPLTDPNNAVIGDPTPDFILKTNNSITWKRLSLSIDCEWKKGGKMWNGTQAVLDHFGRSKNSGLNRNTKGYVFPGVTTDGHINTVPVDLYDPNLPIEENRWVRYGYSGVAEEYIQKADFIRINNLALNYKLFLKKYIQTISFTLSASNLFVWSAYKGADPNQLLFDQSNASGLDFFNIPSSKSYGLNVSIQF